MQTYRIGDHDFGLVNLRRSWAQFRPADTRSPGQARMTTRAVNHQRSGGLADTESELKRRDAARAKLRYDAEEGTGDAMNQWKQRRRSMTSTASGGSKRTTWCQAEGNPPTEVTTGLAPGGEQCISPERRRQGDGAPGGPQEAPRAAGRQRKSPRRGRPTGQQRSRRTHHHHRFRRPARREQPADGVHWAHYPRECVRSQTPREQVPVTQADIFYQPPQGAGGRTVGDNRTPRAAV